MEWCVGVQARAILSKAKVGQARNIPYCSLATCVRRPDSQDWEVEGTLWDDNFLRERQGSEDAAAQSKMWGLGS